MDGLRNAIRIPMIVGIIIFAALAILKQTKSHPKTLTKEQIVLKQDATKFVKRFQASGLICNVNCNGEAFVNPGWYLATLKEKEGIAGAITLSCGKDLMIIRDTRDGGEVAVFSTKYGLQIKRN